MTPTELELLKDEYWGDSLGNIVDDYNIKLTPKLVRDLREISDNYGENNTPKLRRRFEEYLKNNDLNSDPKFVQKLMDCNLMGWEYTIIMYELNSECPPKGCVNVSYVRFIE